ncbi:MAG: GNAT family N-acetyltransferase [Candidatus Lokiarchaeota archaeon]|nr:GNAT family N-acetyltransferase [Candidatus Lokiarchaeota archaeon]
MDVKIIDNLNYEETAKVLLESYVPQWGLVGTPNWNASYVEHLDKSYVKPNNGPYVGVFDGDKLIGIGMGAISNWKVAEVGDVKTINICNLGVLPSYQRKGIATSIVEELIKAVTGKVDFAYRICNEGLNDHLVLSNKCGFVKKIDNVNQVAKIMGKDMVSKAVKFRELGKVMAQLIKTVAGLPKEENKIQEGIIRDGSLADMKQIKEIMDKYQENATILKTSSEVELKNIIESMELLDNVKFSKLFRVWEKDGVIQAFVLGRYEPINYNAGEVVMPIVSDVGFASELDRKTRTSFVVSLIYEFKEKVPEAFGTNIASAHLDEKAIGKAGYNDDRSTRPLFAKLLSEKLKDWFETNWNKNRVYSILYQR